MKKRVVFFLVCFLNLFLISCKKDITPFKDVGYDYFPNTVGTWVIYDVDSIVHNEFTQTVDTFQYQIKEMIESVFIDNSGRKTQRIERYKKDNDTSEWIIKDVWFANLLSTTAEKVEENKRYIKLIFPVKEGEQWNGNAYLDEEEIKYEYTEVDVSKTVNTISFDSTLTVLQIDKFNLIEKEYAVEMYAKHVGMIYKQYIFIDYQTDGGVEYTMTINAYGNK